MVNMKITVCWDVKNQLFMKEAQLFNNDASTAEFTEYK